MFSRHNCFTGNTFALPRLLYSLLSRTHLNGDNSEIADVNSGDAKMQQRVIRLRDAPQYCGMDRNRFNAEIRPNLTEIPIGKQGIGFDRLEIDAWIDEYVACNGRPAQTGELTWDARKRRGSPGATASDISTNASADGAFARALAQVASKKPSDTSPGCQRKSAKLRSTASGRNATSNRRQRDTCSKTNISAASGMTSVVSKD